MKKRTSYIIILSIIIVGIVLDLVSKHFFALRFEANSQKIVVIPNLFEFVFVKNTGAAYGIFGDSTVMLSVVSILFIIGFVAGAWWNYVHTINKQIERIDEYLKK